MKYKAVFLWLVFFVASYLVAAANDPELPSDALCISPACDNLPALVAGSGSGLVRSDRIDCSLLKDSLDRMCIEAASLSCSQGTSGACDCCKQKAVDGKR